MSATTGNDRRRSGDHRVCAAAAEQPWIFQGHAEPPRIVERAKLETAKENGVDLIAEIAGEQIAFEHTEIESYPEQIENGYQILAAVNQVEQFGDPLAQEPSPFALRRTRSLASEAGLKPRLLHRWRIG